MAGSNYSTRAIVDKRAYWGTHIRAQAKSGLSVVEYCRRQGLSRHGFFYWRKKILGSKGGGRGVSAVQVARVSPAMVEGFDMRFRARSGHVIELRSSFSEEGLARLIRVLEGV